MTVKWAKNKFLKNEKSWNHSTLMHSVHPVHAVSAKNAQVKLICRTSVMQCAVIESRLGIAQFIVLRTHIRIRRIRIILPDPNFFPRIRKRIWIKIFKNNLKWYKFSKTITNDLWNFSIYSNSSIFKSIYFKRKLKR